MPGGGSGCDVVDLQLSIVPLDDLTVETGNPDSNSNTNLIPNPNLTLSLTP